MPKKQTYDESTIQTLDWKEHIRTRPGMYIGKIGTGKSFDDGIYILLKEVVDNSIDEFIMGYGKRINISIKNNIVKIRDFGRGIPLGKVLDCVSKINTGAKYDSEVFKRTIGLNGVGTKAVNALSEYFKVSSIRDGQKKEIEFVRGDKDKEHKKKHTEERNGTEISFKPDHDIFSSFQFIDLLIEDKIKNYTYLNSGLTISFNGKLYISKNGLLDLLQSKVEEDGMHYSIIHLQHRDIEIAFTHGQNYGEEYYTFVNGQNTLHGGTHLSAFKESLVKSIRDFFKKDFDSQDIRASIVGAISLKIQNPIFESQTKTKLGSLEMGPNGPTIRVAFNEFFKTHLDNFLHKNPEVSTLLLNRILQSEKERKELAIIKKIASKKNKVARIHNKKLRDCNHHFNDMKISEELRMATTIFITEGNSASGSITKVRNVASQAVFSLRGKPLNSFGMTKKVVYENEEFNLLQHALNIEEGIDGLRYNKVVLATDADVDGMHIRLLLMTFFIQFFPFLLKNNHLHILETPLYRIRNAKITKYCYSKKELKVEEKNIGGKVEITRFKGLGEISPLEFKSFINKNIRLTQVLLPSDSSNIRDLLAYYMGKNTQDRQQFIINHLKHEEF